MSSIVQVPTIEEAKQIQAKVLFSITDQVSKITEASVLNGMFFGTAKLFQKSVKDIAISQAHYYPDYAYGAYLDNIALQYGLPPRFGALGSSLYVRVEAAPGTIYTAGGHTISGLSGINFTVDSNVTVGDAGFAYLKCSSVETGIQANVNPLTLNKMSTPPVGHLSVVNEYKGIGGRDAESDAEFRFRIKNSFNIAATGTISKLEQVFLIYNPNVLRVFNYGSSGTGKIRLAVLAQNAAEFDAGELEQMFKNFRAFLSMSEINLDYILNNGIELTNIDWYPIDVSFQCQLKSGYNADEVRRLAQVRIGKYIDYRIWRLGQRVEWDNILQIVKETDGIDYVPDVTFTPGSDIVVEYGKLPRIRGFEMRDMNGAVISDGGGVLNPVYYPKERQFAYIYNILRSLT
jgi:hypothetical protein